MGSDAAKFTLRFRNRQTHELLGLVADQLGMSKNRLAEQMLERELDAAALLVERDLDSTLRDLRAYRREERLAEDVAAFAEGEAYGEDPLRARMVEPAELGDAFGVMKAFDG
jgi:hypothetical protein